MKPMSQPEVAERSKIKEHASENAASTRAIPDSAKTEARKTCQPTYFTEMHKFNTVPTVGGIVLDDQGQRAGGIPVQKNANTFAITNREGAFELPSAAPAQVKVMANDLELQYLAPGRWQRKSSAATQNQTFKKIFRRQRPSGWGGVCQPDWRF